MDLPFKSGKAAFEYIQQYFETLPISSDRVFYGLVKEIDRPTNKPLVAAISISAQTGRIFTKAKELRVMGVALEDDLSNAIAPGDLVTWKWEEDVNGVPTGLIGDKLEPTLNLEENKFKAVDLKKAQQARFAKNAEDSQWLWKYEIDTFINARFADSEISEDSDNIYISASIRGQILSIGWSKRIRHWVVDTTETLDNTRRSSAKRFKEIVFPDDSIETYAEKQKLKEFFSVGVSSSDTKQIRIQVDGTERALLFTAQEWNNMVVGNECETTKVQVIPWNNSSSMKQLEFFIRAIPGDGVEIEQIDPNGEIDSKTIFHGSVKDLDGYYSDPVKEVPYD